MSDVGGTFETTEPLLSELLRQVREGELQLPDFQRGWVWDDDHIRSLIASVSLSYPIGAVMVLETGGDGVRFRPRLVEGVELPTPPEPAQLILDGQQRLTSLFLALRSGRPVPTKTDKGQAIERFYYLGMADCLEQAGDRLDAVIALPPDRIVRTDFGRQIVLDASTREREYVLGLVPLALAFDPQAYDEWKEGYQEYYDYDKDRTRFLNRFSRDVWQRFQQYKVPVIKLLKGTEKEAVCQVFEKVNTGGVTLSVFELVTASFAADDFRLRDDWQAREKHFHAEPVLRQIDATNFLTAVTLYSSYRRNQRDEGAVSCKRRDVLGLSLDEFREHADTIVRGFIRAAKLLTAERVFDVRSLPYTTQLIPLAAICAGLGDRFEEAPVRKKLAQWYWCGVFGELYGGANESRMAFDLPQVMHWIEGGDEPRTVRDASFTPTRLLTLRTRVSAAYKGIMSLLIQVGCPDFLSGDEVDLNFYFDEAVDIHYIFPKAWCDRSGISERKWDCVVNKTLLTSRTNRILSGDAPSAYLARLERSHQVDRLSLTAALERHELDADALRADDFDAFFLNRASRLLGLIEQATGRPVAGRAADEVKREFGGALGDEW